MNRNKRGFHVVKYVLCVVSTHKAIYCTISLHLAAFCIICYSLYGYIRTSASCCSWSVAIATPPALTISYKYRMSQNFRDRKISRIATKKEGQKYSRQKYSHRRL